MQSTSPETLRSALTQTLGNTAIIFYFNIFFNNMSHCFILPTLIGVDIRTFLPFA